MMKKLFSLSTLLLIFISLSAQISSYPLKSKKEVDAIKFSSKNAKSHQLKLSMDNISWKSKKSKTGDSFTELWFDKSNTTGELGTPQLPTYKKLILLPYGATATATLKNYTQSEFSFKELGIENPLIPVQPSVRKDEDSTKIPFHIKKEVYLKQAYIKKSIVNLEILGNMRNYTIARITVTPIDYNPALETIKVYNDLDIEINVSEGTKSISEIKSISSPYFDIIGKSTYNTVESIYDQYPDLTKYPVKMLIISNRMFEASLAPFIEWKTQKGFKVTTAYTDVIGTSSAQIKTYIQQQYNAGTTEDPAPTFLVFVGDVEQVPSSAVGSQSAKQTDLYYASIDGDIYPEMYYGRLSATSTQQLDNILSKILYYEKYEFTDPQYLNQVTLIAGADGTWNPNIGQPTIKYGTANYFNPAKGYTTVNEYGVSSDPNNAAAQSGYTGCYDADKISVGFINYTAHCSETSWAEPSLSPSAVNAFSNQSEYPLAIANCCLSGDFGTSECIGETWIRAQNKGAVTYIGSSPSSYWKEDMYWSVGAFPMVGDNGGYVPTFAETTTGAYDASFVSNYRTTGAMVLAGNLAVTEADLQDYPRDVTPTYYWEAYNILGDPSLMPYFTSASENEVSHESTVPVGINSIKVNALEGSYVSITKNLEIIGTSYFEQTQEIDIPIQTVSEPCDLIVTVTRSQTIPYIDTINAVVVSGPYITLNATSISDATENNNSQIDFGETIKTNLAFKNVGLETSTNTRVLLTNHSGFATLTSSDSVFIGSIQSETGNNLVTLNDAFTFDISSNVPDKSTEKFTLTIKSDQGTWTSTLNLQINAPKITSDDLVIDDSVIGNNNGDANVGESFYGIVKLSNSGHSDVTDLVVSVTIPDSIKDLVLLNYEPIVSVPINTGESYDLKFRLGMNPSITNSINIPVVINISSPSNTTLNQEVVKYFEVISNNTITMNNESIVTCFALFTDSGGDAAYSNNENYTKTITSESGYSTLKVSFSEFALESGWDYLYVYDGASATSNQVAGSPFNGSTIPADIYSTGQSLTFKFTSDGGVSDTGWKATISCVEPSQIPLCVINPTPANNTTGYTSNKLEWEGSSDAQFYDVYIGNNAENLALLERVYSNSIFVTLENNHEYFWQVIPGNYMGICDKACETWSFQTASSLGEITMSNGAFAVDSTWFYDSGSSSNSYSNNENYTLTFSPKFAGTKVKVAFDQFDVETNTNCGYDFLQIFDGPTTSSTLIGKYCGTSLPPTYTSTGAGGELTFKFYSDGGVANAGWKAKISTVGTVTLYTLTITVKDNGTPLSNASVSVNDLIKISDSNGEVQFSIPSGNFNYTVNASGFTAESGTGTNSGANQSLTVDLTKQFNSSIVVLDNLTNSPIHGALVTVNSINYYTSSAGIALIKSTEGTQTVTIEKLGYSTVTSDIDVTTEGGDFEFKLNAGTYTLTTLIKDVDGNPLASALIDVNGTTATTGVDGIATIDVPFGIHKLLVSKDNFLSIEQWISINEDTQVNVFLDFLVSELTKISYTVISDGPLGFTTLEGASISVYLGEQVYSQLTTNTLGQIAVQLPEGTYKYIIEKEGYTSSALVEFMVGSDDISIKDTLIQNTYTITFDVKSNGSAIDGASVTLNGYTTLQTNTQGVAVFNTVGYTKGLSYSVEKNGFYTVSGAIDINSSKTIDINLISTGIEELTSNKPKIYPNPVSDNLFIESVQPIQTIQIISITGGVLAEIQINGLNKTSLPVANLTRGTYITRIIFTSGKIAHSKLIKL